MSTAGTDPAHPAPVGLDPWMRLATAQVEKMHSVEHHLAELRKDSDAQRDLRDRRLEAMERAMQRIAEAEERRAKVAEQREKRLADAAERRAKTASKREEAARRATENREERWVSLARQGLDAAKAATNTWWFGAAVVFLLGLVGYLSGYLGPGQAPPGLPTIPSPGVIVRPSEEDADGP